MNDSLDKPRWWLIATAGVLAVLTLFYFTGSWISVAVFFGALVILVAFRKRRVSRTAVHTCVRCGALLNPNARECRACGSASWTIRN